MAIKLSEKGYLAYLEFYLKPKRFEFIGRQSIYQILGIKFFKKYLPTHGDISRSIRNVKSIRHSSNQNVKSLIDLERSTRVYEIRHWLGLFIFIIVGIYIKEVYTTFDKVFVVFIFLLINVYPILLQRHNRVRIIKVLERQGYSSPYS